MPRRLRIMREEDLESVRQTEAQAFSAWWEKWNPGKGSPAVRSLEMVASCWRRDPQGCFVMEGDHRLLGSIFSCTWGRVGWFGALGVLPEAQGQGIGKELIQASVGYMRKEPARLIGLETQPDVPGNLGLYGRLGFELRLPTVFLMRDVPGAEGLPASVRLWSEATQTERVRWMEDLRRAADQITPGLDYSKEILAWGQPGQGEVLILLDGETAVGASVLPLIPALDGDRSALASVRTLFLHPGITVEDGLGELLQATGYVASGRGLQSLVVCCNGRHARALDVLYARGYRAIRSMVRLVLRGTDDGAVMDGTVDLCRWAG